VRALAADKLALDNRHTQAAFGQRPGTVRPWPFGQ
jgi:hypothetical protein